MAIQVQIAKSGGDSSNVALDSGATIQNALDKAGISANEVTLNGDPTSDLTQTLRDNDDIFVATAQKAGL